MSIKVALRHRTTYEFDRPVHLGPHIVRLRPAPHSRTPIEAYSLKVHPETHFLNWQQDPFGNYLARLVFADRTTKLDIDVEVIADLTVINPFDFFLDEENGEYVPFKYGEKEKKNLLPYLDTTESGPLLMEWMKEFKQDGQRTIEFLVEVNSKLNQDIGYSIRMEPGVQTCEQTLERKVGSCRDTGWLLCQILRHQGLATRFVSGYIVQLSPDEKSLDGPSGTEVDFTDLHAWCEVYLPGAGWIGLDPTSGLFCSEGHIPLFCTPEPSSAAPVDGLVDECETKFSYTNTVERIHEDPRVTLPYTDDQWEAIDAMGNKVDEDLREMDVRLTMGGEPTFVSIDDMEADEWNTSADGPMKRQLSDDLLRRMHKRFAPGGMLIQGEGKWYPGEEIPRWAMGCFWRKDGKPVWQDPSRMSHFFEDNGYGIEEASALMQEITKGLGLNPKHIQPGHEDFFYYMWKESTLPENLDPLKANLKDTLERREMARLLDKGLGEETGYALPLFWDGEKDEWVSSPWEFRRGQMFLIPGSSPMGLRLPLGSIPWHEEKKRPPQDEESPLEEKPPLGNLLDRIAQRYEQPILTEDPRHNIAEQKLPEEKEEEHEGMIAHTALCVEARAGCLYVFLPPANKLEHYLEVVSAVETAARRLDLRVALEGYDPPKDPRLKNFKVTPDPGVIEVNVTPVGSWSELRRQTIALYEEARLCRLGTEKFLVDGRHTGTGGGNHVTIGGATPPESPFFKSPTLLRSLLTFWQHHPSLSYLFSGLYIGPTCQAPRVDEARESQLYDLEIAFSNLPEGEAPVPWVVDRVLRNLLTDITGNTHRAEFCIDKLYSPDSSAGRQGLVEFRGFEMPPHARMSLVQTLLLRSLIAWFSREPYHKPLVRWGTELHDRHLLPQFVWSDLSDVVRSLNSAGYPFQLDWFAPFHEFRFPVYGRVQYEGVEIELRFAIEPWHVLGEESTGQGTARYVDSSVERLQVKVTGMVEGRHIITCNGRRLPLRSTGRKGEYVAGVRYKAWAPYSAMHPTVKIQTPLTFDLMDQWNGRSLGGCVYHVSHPGGLSYDSIPVNAWEAESRKINRFWQQGHTQGRVEAAPELQPIARYFEGTAATEGPADPPYEEPSSEYPVTLDLLRDRTV